MSEQTKIQPEPKLPLFTKEEWSQYCQSVRRELYHGARAQVAMMGDEDLPLADLELPPDELIRKVWEISNPDVCESVLYDYYCMREMGREIEGAEKQ